MKHDGVDMIALLLYVDDIILTGSNSVKVQIFIQELNEVFELKDIGRLSIFWDCKYNTRRIEIYSSISPSMQMT